MFYRNPRRYFHRISAATYCRLGGDAEDYILYLQGSSPILAQKRQVRTTIQAVLFLLPRGRCCGNPELLAFLSQKTAQCLVPEAGMKQGNMLQ